MSGFPDNQSVIDKPHGSHTIQQNKTNDNMSTATKTNNMEKILPSQSCFSRIRIRIRSMKTQL